MSSSLNRMASVLARNWWLLLLRGLAAITFGILTWMQPGISLTALVLLFGAYAMTDGIFSIWGVAATWSTNDDRWLLLLKGLLSIGFAMMTFMAPAITALVLLFYIAAWAIATGVLEIVAAIQLRKEIEGEWLWVLSGLASVVFGALLLAAPGPGALTVVWLIGTYAVVVGLMLLMLAFRVKKLAA